MKKRILVLTIFFGITSAIFSMEEGNGPQKSKSTIEEKIQNKAEKTESSNNNNAQQSPVGTFTKALQKGHHEQFVSIFSQYKEVQPEDIIRMLQKENLNVAKLVSSYFHYRWIHLYYSMLVKQKIDKPELKSLELLKKSSELNNTMVDENPAVEFSDSIPSNLQSLINNIVKSSPLLSKKYFYVKTFKDEPKTLKESDGKLITFNKNGEMQLNIELTPEEDYNKGVIIHEITHAIFGENWMKQILKKENLPFTKPMNHLVEREADLLLPSVNTEYAKLAQEHLETLHKKQPGEASETHPSTVSRLEDIIYLNKLLIAELKINSAKVKSTNVSLE